MSNQSCTWCYVWSGQISRIRSVIAQSKTPVNVNNKTAGHSTECNTKRNAWAYVSIATELVKSIVTSSDVIGVEQRQAKRQTNRQCETSNCHAFLLIAVMFSPFLQEMSKAGCKLPLLIGGATTSKMHTAVKISPQYASPEVSVSVRPVL